MATPQSLQANFQMTAGDTVALDIQVSDLNNDPIDLDGATGTWAMAKSVEGPAIVTKTVGAGGIVILDPSSDGILEITLLVADTINLLPGVYYHELQIVDAGGDTSTVIRGNITVSAALIS